MRILLSLLILLSSVQFLHARPMTEQETASLNKGLEQFKSDLEAANGEGIVAIIPPKVISLISKKAKLDEAILRDKIKAQMDEVMKQATLHEMSFDTSANEIKDEKLASGDEISYSIIPLSFTMTMQDTKMKMDQPMFALLENEKWYFVRVEQPAQLNMLIEVYPFVKKIELPESRSQIIQ